MPDTNLKRAPSSMKRRISHAEAMRSICTPCRVTQTSILERARLQHGRDIRLLVGHDLALPVASCLSRPETSPCAGSRPLGTEEIDGHDRRRAACAAGPTWTANSARRRQVFSSAASARASRRSRRSPRRVRYRTAPAPRRRRDRRQAGPRRRRPRRRARRSRASASGSPRASRRWPAAHRPSPSPSRPPALEPPPNLDPRIGGLGR